MIKSLTREATLNLYALHHHFSDHLAEATQIFDADTDPEAELTEDQVQTITRAQAETPVRERVACALLAAVVNRDFTSAVQSLYNHAWTQVDEQVAVGYQAAGWRIVAESLSAALDHDLDAELAALTELANA